MRAVARPALDPRRVLITLGFGIVLAILIIPFAGPYTVPALLIVAGLVILDLWWQLRSGESPYRRLQRQPLWMRLVAILGLLALLIGGALLLRALGVNW